jgi:uroporphyrinogen-III synthase
VTGTGLRGQRVVVTRDRRRAQKLSRLLSGNGAKVIALPVIEIQPPSAWTPLDSAVERLAGGAYAWALFASPTAVKAFSERGSATGLAHTRVGAVGPSTAAALRARGVRVDLTPEEFTAEALAEALGQGEGEILLPRVEDGPRGPVEHLTSLGWRVDEVPAYRNVPVAPDPGLVRELRAGEFDAVTFTSGSAARRFAALVPPAAVGLGLDEPAARITACIGPATAEDAEAAGIRVDVVASKHTVEGLVDALVAHVMNPL